VCTDVCVCVRKEGGVITHEVQRTELRSKIELRYACARHVEPDMYMHTHTYTHTHTHTRQHTDVEVVAAVVCM